MFAIRKTREMMKRHGRAERLLIKRERVRVARAEYAARMHLLVKLVLPNQYFFFFSARLEVIGG